MSLIVGNRVDEIGDTVVWNAFFDTVGTVLESGKPGSRFPLLHEQLRNGLVSPEQVPAALQELVIARRELAGLPREGSPLPAHHQAQDLAQTFVTSDGKFLLDVLHAGLSEALSAGVAVHLNHVSNPFRADSSAEDVDLVAVFRAEKRYDDPLRTEGFWRDFDIEFDFLSKFVRYQRLEGPDGAYGVRVGLPVRHRRNKKARGELREALHKYLAYRCSVTDSRGTPIVRGNLDDVLDSELGAMTRGGDGRLP